MDADTKGAFDAALKKLQDAGVTVVDVEMPKLMELNGAVGFPLALYEAYDDVVGVPQDERHRRVDRSAGQADRQPGREGHLRRPRHSAQAAGPEQHGRRCQAGVRRGDEEIASGAAGAVPRHLQAQSSRRAGVPDRAQGGAAGDAGVEQRAGVPRRHPEHRPRQQRRRAGAADSDRASARRRNCRSAWSSTARPAATGGSSPSAWRSRTCSDDCRRRRSESRRRSCSTLPVYHSGAWR